MRPSKIELRGRRPELIELLANLFIRDGQAGKPLITLDEHLRIIERERNPERKTFYQLCWHLGGSQGDIANLSAEDVDWDKRIVGYHRRKTKTIALLHFGDEVASILCTLPASGPLFPYLRSVRSADRATEFKQRCRGLGINGISLHSYRYAWAVLTTSS